MDEDQLYDGVRGKNEQNYNPGCELINDLHICLRSPFSL